MSGTANVQQVEGNVEMSVSGSFTGDEAAAVAQQVTDAAQAATNFVAGQMHEAQIAAAQASALVAQTGVDASEAVAQIATLEDEVATLQAKVAELEAAEATETATEAPAGSPADEQVAPDPAVPDPAAVDDSATPADVVPGDPVVPTGAEAPTEGGGA